MEYAAADTLPVERLVRLWNRGYEGYFVPVNMTEGQFRDHLRRGQIDLSRSLLAVLEGEPVGFSLLGVRGERGWIGGFGIAPEHRGRGLAFRLFAEHVARFAAAGLRTVQLEVLVENWARKVYERAGMETTRRLPMMRGIPGFDAVKVDGAPVTISSADPREALAHSERLHADWPAVWQREPLWVEQALAEHHTALVAGSSERPDGVVIFGALPNGGVSILDAAADSEPTAGALLAALARRHPGAAVTVINEPEDSPFHRALVHAGCEEVKAQWEMWWKDPARPDAVEQ